MLAVIAQTIDRYRMLEDVRRVGVAVSGGADSVCLLHVLLKLAPRYGISLSVLHADHGLRGQQSRADADFVRDLAARLGLPFYLRELDLTAAGGNLEQAARQARLDFFADRIASAEVDRVATGHTRSDQAETVLFRFLRGSGSAGLAGIRPSTFSGIIRPLIGVGREAAREYLRDRRLEWREDSTNQSPNFARNRLRLDLLPRLAWEWNPAIEETLAHTADWALAEESWWAEETERLAATHLVRRGNAVLVRAEVLTRLPLAAARRLVRHAIELVRGLRAVSFLHVEAVLDLARAPEGGTARLPGLVACRSFDWVRFALPAPRPRWRVNPRVPSITRLPGTGRALCLEIADNSETISMPDYVYNIEMGHLDRTRFSSSLVLRNWEPGDRYQPIGTCGEKKLKNLFQEARIPVWERAEWPVLETDQRIIWSRRFGPAAWCAADRNTPVVLRVREAPQ